LEEFESTSELSGAYGCKTIEFAPEYQD